MAKPIKHTPIVTGKDAVNFFSKLEANKNRKVDASVIVNIRKEAAQLKSLLRN